MLHECLDLYDLGESYAISFVLGFFSIPWTRTDKNQTFEEISVIQVERTKRREVKLWNAIIRIENLQDQKCCN